MEHTPLVRLGTCPSCSSPDLVPHTRVIDHHLSKETFELRRCAACGLVVTDPRPGQNNISRYYASEDYISHSDQTRTLGDRLYRLAHAYALKRKLALVRSHCSHGSLLDVGCGTGSFLSYASQNGYVATGVEPSPKAQAIARSRGAVTVFSSLAELPHSTFEGITLWHVLEHFDQPLSELQRLHDHLSPTGALFIAVPNRSSWDSEHYGEHWAAWDVPRHLSHFRTEDVSSILDRAGFKLTSTHRMLFDAPYIAMLSEKYRGGGPFFSLLKGCIVGSWSNAKSILGSRPTSSTLYVAHKA